MKVKVGTEIVNIIDNLNVSNTIREVSDTAFMSGQADDAFYICDLDNILDKHRLWLEKFPRIEPFYAMKCNPNPLVVKMLSRLKIGFDCASKSEISQAINAGVPASQIIYANPCKQISHIKYAGSNGVDLMTFDSIVELKKIRQSHSEAKLVLRIFVGATQARCPLGLKFGAQFDDVKNLLSSAVDQGLQVVGVSFHVGSGCFDPTAYKTAISLARGVFDIARNMGIILTLLDIGGGFPGNLDTTSNIELFENVCYTINDCLDELFPPGEGVRVIAEPGRFYVSSAFHLACTVTSTRSSFDLLDPFNETINYTLNDGVYGSFNCIVFDHYIGDHYLLNDVFSTSESESQYRSVFWGPTCDSADKVLEGIQIRRISVGERVVFKNMGAYTMAAGSNFNGFQMPYIYYVATYSSWRQLSYLLAADDHPFDRCSDPYSPDIGSFFEIFPVEADTVTARVA